MKTKDFIKMLQEADPEGEGYVRLPCGGAPWFAENKPGYWDGSYQYLEKINPDKGNDWGNMKIVTSKDGYKIDIVTLDHDTIIWDYNGDMDEIKKRIIVPDKNFYSDEEKEKFWKYVEEEANYAKGFHIELSKKFYDEVMEEYFSDNMWEIRQPLDTKIGHYHCMKAHAFFRRPRQLNQGECGVLIRSGEFYPEKKKKYYVWKHDPEKGKDWSIK